MKKLSVAPVILTALLSSCSAYKNTPTDQELMDVSTKADRQVKSTLELDEPKDNPENIDNIKEIKLALDSLFQEYNRISAVINVDRQTAWTGFFIVSLVYDIQDIKIQIATLKTATDLSNKVKNLESLLPKLLEDYSSLIAGRASSDQKVEAYIIRQTIDKIEKDLDKHSLEILRQAVPDHVAMYDICQQIIKNSKPSLEGFAGKNLETIKSLLNDYAQMCSRSN